MTTKAIATYLKENGITQKFLCEKTGMTRNSINSALNNKRKLSVDEYEKICIALKVPYDFFFANTA